jgi:hypothetical protein
MVAESGMANAYRTLLEDAARLFGVEGIGDLDPYGREVADRAIAAVREAFTDEEFDYLGGVEFFAALHRYAGLMRRARAILRDIIITRENLLWEASDQLGSPPPWEGMAPELYDRAARAVDAVRQVLGEEDYARLSGEKLDHEVWARAEAIIRESLGL